MDMKIKELNEAGLSLAVGGKDVSVMSIVEKLIPLASKYPEIIEIIDAVEKQDYGTLLTKLQELISKYPELASIIG